MSDQRFNTGNPIGSNSPLDRSDNTRNLDVAVNAEQDTFQDRLGKSRLTWAGIVKAGSGDPAIAVDAAARAVDAAGLAENAAGRAENAEAIVDAANIKAEVDRAEAARDAAFVNADVYPTVAQALLPENNIAVGGQFQVLVGLEMVRYRRIESSPFYEEVARLPASGRVDQVSADLSALSALASREAVMLPGTAGDINFSFTTNRLIIADGQVRLLVGTQAILLSGYSVDLSPAHASRVNQVLLDRTTSAMRVTQMNVQPAASEVRVALFRVNTREVFGVPMYFVDGALPDSGDEPAPSGSVYTGTMVAAATSDINFDFNNGVIELADQRIRLLWAENAPLMNGASIAMPASTSNGFRLIYDTVTGAVTWKNVRFDLVENEIQIAIFHRGLQSVYGVPYYRINGEEPSVERDNIVSANIVVAAGTLDPDYDQPTLPDYSAQQQQVAGDYNGIYALYDALQAAHPEYISSVTLGTDALGNELRQWSFIPPVRTLFGSDRAQHGKPKLLLFSGIHGYEQSAVWNLYFVMREICERWHEDKRLEALRFGAVFVIVPVANPTGFNAYTRKNHNKVDLERNFPSGWVLGSNPTASTYGGAAPMDQAETVILEQVIRDNTDAVYFGSMHNLGTAPDRQSFLWVPSATLFGKRLADRLVSIASVKAKKRYAYLPDNDYFLGYADTGLPGGSSGYHAAHAFGMNGGTFEISRNWDWIEGTPLYSEEVATIGAESLVNWVLLNMKHGTDLKNSKIRL